jgi:hypothetical protein
LGRGREIKDGRMVAEDAGNGGLRSRLGAYIEALPDDLGSLTQNVAVGRGLALGIGSLTERAALAEREVRAASWEGPAGIAARVDRTDALDADAARAWAAVESGEVEPAGPHVDPRDLDPAAAAAARDAESAIREAHAAVGRAHRAVLAAQLASAEQQATPAAGGGRRFRVPPSVSRQRGALWHAVVAEFRYLLRRKPRKVLRATLFAVLSGAIYLAFIRVFQWNTYGRWAPYLAVLFVSSVMATSACYNSFCFDARRVRIALDKGARLWQIMVVKNVALMALVFPLGLAMCIALALMTGKPATLVASIGLVLCILLLWSGVGNMLSVLLPIRDASLKVHRQEGTLTRFAVEFGVTWTMSAVVLFLLIWRVYSAKGMGDRYGSTLLAVLFVVLSGILAWINMTVMATAFTNSPAVYRRLRQELDWEPALRPADARTSTVAGRPVP